MYAYNDYGSENPATVSISFLSTPKGDCLVTYAYFANNMAKTTLYNVNVRNNNYKEVTYVVFRKN